MLKLFKQYLVFCSLSDIITIIIIIIIIMAYYANKAQMTHTYETHTQTHTDKNTQDKIHNTFKYAI